MNPSMVMEVVILAEYMVLPSLLRACQRELAKYVDSDSAEFLSSFADEYHLFKLESLCEEFLEPKTRKNGRRRSRPKKWNA